MELEFTFCSLWFKCIQMHTWRRKVFSSCSVRLYTWIVLQREIWVDTHPYIHTRELRPVRSTFFHVEGLRFIGGVSYCCYNLWAMASEIPSPLFPVPKDRAELGEHAQLAYNWRIFCAAKRLPSDLKRVASYASGELTLAFSRPHVRAHQLYNKYRNN